MKPAKKQRSVLFLCWLSIVCGVLVAAQDTNPASSPAASYTLKVPSTPAWTDTQVDLRPGDVLRINALAISGGNAAPEPDKSLPAGGLELPAAPACALLGKVGAETPFLLAPGKQAEVERPGRLMLGRNAGQAPCSGELSVTLQVTAATMKSKLASAAEAWLSGQLGSGSSASATAPAESAVASTAAAPAKLAVADTPLDAQLGKNLDRLPRRVSDEFKNPGDMANFVIVGSEQQVKSALTAASWHVADQSKAGAIASAILETYEKQDYVQMPMSVLYLFGRAQDFGYEQAEPYEVVASRHHFRIWKAPFAWNGRPVWVGAGTHDIGFEKDQRNGKVTHKIDPAVDGERDHIGQTLEATGKVKSMNYYLPSNPVREAKNATGGSYHSDGRLLVIFLQ